jgi:hypothetical protein
VLASQVPAEGEAHEMGTSEIHTMVQRRP